MNGPLSFTKSLIVFFAIFSVVTLAYCATPTSWKQRKIDFEFTGQVLDADTNAPIEGAYVLAVYEREDRGLAATARYCVKTKGMTTGKEGRFNFPVEKRDNMSPRLAVAIKADYFFTKYVVHDFAVQNNQNKESYSNRHIYLKKQDPQDLKFNYGYTTCERPESREAVAANVEFLKRERDEIVRLGSGFPWYKRALEIQESQISYFENFVSFRAK